MKLRVAAATAALLLAGCSTAVDQDTGSPTAATTTATQSDVAASKPTPSAATSTTAPPASCADYPASAIDEPAAEQEAIAAAVGAALPDGIELKPGVQVIDSTSEPGQVEAVVRICQGSQMSEAELIEVASAIAVAIKADPVSDALEVLVVSSWYPDGEYLAQGGSVTTEYGMYTWDPDAAAPMASNWE